MNLQQGFFLPLLAVLLSLVNAPSNAFEPCHIILQHVMHICLLHAHIPYHIFPNGSKIQHRIIYSIGFSYRLDSLSSSFFFHFHPSILPLFKKKHQGGKNPVQTWSTRKHLFCTDDRRTKAKRTPTTNAELQGLYQATCHVHDCTSFRQFQGRPFGVSTWPR